VQRGQGFEILDEGWRDEVAGKVEMFKCTGEILDSGNKHFCCIRLRWRNIGLRKPGYSVGDARSGRCGDKDVMRPVVGKCGAKVVTRDTMACPCTPFLRCLVNEDCSAGRGNRVRTEIERSTSEAVISGNGRVWLPR